ncbi:hypothetical protein DFP73DRAFT_311052 [Morchella snyderi]|nr:hypothetical protein DFP73DRAFT_311052 [Morchella snyderi]
MGGISVVVVVVVVGLWLWCCGCVLVSCLSTPTQPGSATEQRLAGNPQPPNPNLSPIAVFPPPVSARLNPGNDRWGGFLGTRFDAVCMYQLCTSDVCVGGGQRGGAFLSSLSRCLSYPARGWLHTCRLPEVSEGAEDLFWGWMLCCRVGTHTTAMSMCYTD